MAQLIENEYIGGPALASDTTMNTDSLKIIEKAFSLDWCKANYVLIGPTTELESGEKSTIVYISDIDHLPLIGEFIRQRLEEKCNLIPKFVVANKDEIIRYLQNMESLKNTQAENDPPSPNELNVFISQSGKTVSSSKQVKSTAPIHEKNDLRNSVTSQADASTQNKSLDSDFIRIDMSNKRTVLGVGGALSMLIGALSPVATLPIVGNINYVANGRGDGVFVIVLSLVSMYFAITERYKLLRFTGCTSLMLMFFTLFRFQFAISKANSSIAELGGSPFRGLAEATIGSFGLGWGWMLLIAGAMTILITSFVEISEGQISLKSKYFNPALAEDLRENIVALATASFFVGLLFAAVTSAS